MPGDDSGTIAAIAPTALLAAGAPALAREMRTFESSAGRLAVEPVAEGLDFPWAIQFLSDERLIVTERSGTLRIGRIAAWRRHGGDVGQTGAGGRERPAPRKWHNHDRFGEFSARACAAATAAARPTAGLVKGRASRHSAAAPAIDACARAIDASPSPAAISAASAIIER